MRVFLLFLFLCLLCPFSANATDAKFIDMPLLQKIIKDNKGKVVMLNFFATWCPPCREEIPDLIKLRKNKSEKKLVIVGISVDEDSEVIPQFISKNRINYPVYVAKKDVIVKFKISSVPFNVILDKDGSVFFAEPGRIAADALDQAISDLINGKMSR